MGRGEGRRSELGATLGRRGTTMPPRVTSQAARCDRVGMGRSRAWRHVGVGSAREAAVLAIVACEIPHVKTVIELARMG